MRGFHKAILGWSMLFIARIFSELRGTRQAGKVGNLGHSGGYENSRQIASRRRKIAGEFSASGERAAQIRMGMTT
jgi:hypothetical protein